MYQSQTLSAYRQWRRMSHKTDSCARMHPRRHSFTHPPQRAMTFWRLTEPHTLAKAFAFSAARATGGAFGIVVPWSLLPTVAEMVCEGPVAAEEMDSTRLEQGVVLAFTLSTLTWGRPQQITTLRRRYIWPQGLAPTVVNGASANHITQVAQELAEAHPNIQAAIMGVIEPAGLHADGASPSRSNDSRLLRATRWRGPLEEELASSPRPSQLSILL